MKRLLVVLCVLVLVVVALLILVAVPLAFARARSGREVVSGSAEARGGWRRVPSPEWPLGRWA